MSRFQGNYADVGKAADYVLDASGGDSIVVPDAHLLFTGAFKRVGPDLLIDGDGRRALLPDYFSHEHGATLLSPNGARLGPDTVRALAGEDSPWQVAQAGGAGGPPEVGTVRTLAGAATVQRGGASHQLSTGAPIYLGDVVETDASSTLGIILRDNTVFSLSASARMVMNELVYDPARSDNAMAISLVQGTFVFITGQVAKTGSVAITTPVATMGIRGTTPIVRLSTVDGSGEFGIAPDPGPGNPVGNYTLTLPSGMQTNVASPDVIIRVTSAASFDAITKTFAEQQSDQQIVAPAYQVYSLIGQRGDIPAPNQQANATGKGQGSGGFQYAFAVMNFAELSATQLLDNSVIAQPETPSDLTTYQDVLRSVIVGSALGVDLDTTEDGVNRQVQILENAGELPVTSATQIILPSNVTHLISATVVLQNQLPGDNLLVGALPPGITVTITFGSIQLSGVASAADYIAAIQAIHFVNTSDNPSTEVRAIVVTVTADNGQTATATTFVTIEPINDAPEAKDDTGSAMETGDVLANDTDVDTSHASFTVTAIRIGDTEGGGTAGSVGLGLAGAHGTLTLNADGSYSYVVNETDTAVQALNAGGTLTDAFNYTMSDGSLTDQAVLTITITGSDDGPTISDVADIGFTEAAYASAQDLSASGTVSFDDIDANDVVDISTALTTGAVWSGGTIDAGLKALLEAGFTASATDAAAPGSTPWSYSVDNAALDFLAAGETITLTYTLTATDSANATATDTVTITITGSNDGPTISDVADIGFTEDAYASAQDLSASGTVSFDDIDANDVVDISTALTTGAVWSGGTIDAGLKALLEAGFTASATDAAAPGSTPWSYSVDNAALDFLAAGETITLTYTLTATDSANATATDTVTITITGSNDGPTISDVADIGFTEDAYASAQDLSASGTVSFDDIDANDVVDISTALTTGAVWSGGTIDAGLKALLEAGFTASATDAAAPGSTPWSYSVDNAALGFLAAGETITLTYTLTATDSANATATDTVTITITGSNDGPTISDVADIGFTEDAYASAQDLSASGTVSFDDIDADDVVDISTALTTGAVWSGGTIDAGLKALLEAGFTASATDAAAPGSTPWSYSVDNAALDFLAAGETITLTYTLTATDSANATATDTVTITITGTNDTPTLVVDQGNLPGANDQVFESGLAAGSAQASDGEFATGTFTLSDADGLDDIESVTITGLAASTVLIGSLVGSTFAGAHGTLTITAYNSTTGVASYTYELTSATMDLDGFEQDTFMLSVSDGTASSPDAVLAIDIVDDGPEIFGIEKVVLANTGGVFTGTIYVHYGADGSNALSPATVIVPTDADPVTTNSGLVITSWDNLPGITETLSADGKTLTATFEEGGGTFYVLQVDDAANTYTLTYSERPVVKLGLDFGSATGGPGDEYLDVPAGSDPLPDFTVRFNGGIFDGTKLVDLGQGGSSDDVKPTGAGFGVGGSNGQTTIENNEGFFVSFRKEGTGSEFDDQVDSFSFAVQREGGGGDHVVTVNWIAYDDSNEPIGGVHSQTLTLAVNQQNYSVTIDPAGEFTSLSVWFTNIDAGDGNIRIENFSIGTSVLPADQSLQFGIVAIDADGDVSTVQTLDVLLQGGEGSDFTVTSNIDTSSLYLTQSSGSVPASDTYTGVGAAVDVIDFSTAAFTTFAFGADAPIDPSYAIDILSHFDGGSHQIDLSGIFDKSAGAGVVNAGNIDDYVQFVDQGGGKVNLLVDPDGAGGSSAAIKIAEISGTAGPDNHPHALGSSASDVIAVVFDQAQPAANVAVAHAG